MFQSREEKNCFTHFYSKLCVPSLPHQLHVPYHQGGKIFSSRFLFFWCCAKKLKKGEISRNLSALFSWQNMKKYCSCTNDDGVYKFLCNYVSQNLLSLQSGSLTCSSLVFCFFFTCGTGMRKNEI